MTYLVDDMLANIPHDVDSLSSLGRYQLLRAADHLNLLPTTNDRLEFQGKPIREMAVEVLRAIKEQNSLIAPQNPPQINYWLPQERTRAFWLRTLSEDDLEQAIFRFREYCTKSQLRPTGLDRVFSAWLSNQYVALTKTP